ncbi:hypothetical protein EON77_14820 [bacterium]|nr:MAG: hypothetical protein EON77_14820 [bacterium]
MARTLFALVPMLFLAAHAGNALAAEPTDCDRSESRLSPSPDGRFTASVQEQVCAVGRRAAAAVTVLLIDAKDASRSTRVAATPVPRSRDEWPRAVWRDATTLEVWVPNLTEMLTFEGESQGVRVEMKRCNDDPAAREQVASYKRSFEQYKRDTTAWVEKRKVDAASVGPRPERPREPTVPTGRCDPSVGSRAAPG